MATYLRIAGRHLKAFKWFKIHQVPRAKNIEANGLAKLESGLEDGALSQTPIKILAEPNTKESADHVMPIDPPSSWIDPTFKFLAEGKILKDKNEEGSGTTLTDIRS